jgi:D-threo-aldose 1-dehydrogenase
VEEAAVSVFQPTDVRRLPRTGQALTVLGMGTAPLGNLYAAVDDAAARATLDLGLDAGLRYIDTAPYYGHGLAEHRVGAALRARPAHGVTLSTKVGRLLRPVPAGRPAPAGARGSDWAQPLPFEPVFDYGGPALRRALEDSLQRLGLARVDIALVHDIGTYTHGARHAHHWQQFAGSGLRELDALRREGLAGAIGLGVNEWQVALDALAIADLDAVLLAGRYTLLEQGALPFLDTCRRREVGVVVGGPFNSGVLASGARPGARFDYQDAPDAVLDRVRQLDAACRECGVPLPAVALQFPLAHPAVVSVVAGARDATELRQIIDWMRMDIPSDLWRLLAARGLVDPAAPLP